MLVRTSRFTLRDFREADRQAFVAYQMDPRYRQLYRFGDDHRRAHELFERFLSWQRQDPRRDFQVGIFGTDTGRLCGCCGLRRSDAPEGAAVLGIELTPDDWGRYRLAIDVASALIEHAFSALDLDLIIGRTASGNTRVERLARWFGAKIIARHDGPEWMAARRWSEVDWELRRDAWTSSPRREQLTSVLDRRSSYPTDGVPRALDRGPRDSSDDVRDAALSGVWDAKR
jgi:[ribosomal protein S5]-alanine N-acetyltransferase